MGSLMAGWDSPVLKSKSGVCKRNRSLTKEDIEAYWRSKNKTMEEHLKDIINSPKGNQQQNIIEESERKFERSSSLPEGYLDMDDETSFDKLNKNNGWWTRSNWAFLNEPPKVEGAPNKYVTQYHVANLASTSKSNSAHGITAV